MNYYDKINWKNRSEGKTTKISAERLNHMDNQIFDNANAIGNVEKIADIGDGTLCGAAESLKGTTDKLTQSLNSKQDKLTNPLTKSDVVDNLTNTSTNTPLSAKQGNVLKGLIDKLSTLITNISNALNSHKHKVNAKNVKVPDVSVTGGSWTQVSAKHGVNTNYVTSVEPYVDGAPLCNATDCWLDGEYIKWNVSNVKQGAAVANKVTVGAVIRYL